MKRALTVVLLILALIRWAAAAHVTMQAGTTQVTMPVLLLAVALAACLLLAAATFAGAIAWQETHR